MRMCQKNNRYKRNWIIHPLFFSFYFMFLQKVCSFFICFLHYHSQRWEIFCWFHFYFDLESVTLSCTSPIFEYNNFSFNFCGKYHHHFSFININFSKKLVWKGTYLTLLVTYSPKNSTNLVQLNQLLYIWTRKLIFIESSGFIVSMCLVFFWQKKSWWTAHACKNISTECIWVLILSSIRIKF